MIYEQLVATREAARKAHDMERLGTLQVILSAVKNAAIDRQKKELDDAEVQEVLARQAKQLRDALSDFTRAGRTDLIDKTQREIELIESYLPASLSDEELRAAISNAIVQSGAASQADMGAVMGRVMGAVKGRVDGGRVRILVQEMLGG